MRRVDINALSLEDTSDGKTRVDQEIEIYGILQCFAELENADSVEYQEQWTVKVAKTDTNPVSGQLRMRKKTVGRKTSYLYTTKVLLEDGTPKDNCVEVSEENFEMFKLLAPQGMKKHRYVFNRDGMVFEVDVFLKPGTTDEDKDYFPHVKIDLENVTEVPSILPVTLDNVIVNTKDERFTEEQRGMVWEWYEKYFITKK